MALYNTASRELEAELTEWYDSGLGRVWRALTDVGGLVSPIAAAAAINEALTSNGSEEPYYNVIKAGILGTIAFPILRHAPYYLKSRKVGTAPGNRLRHLVNLSHHPKEENQARGSEALRNMYAGVGTLTLLYFAGAEGGPELFGVIGGSIPLIAGAAFSGYLSQKTRQGLESRITAEASRD